MKSFIFTLTMDVRDYECDLQGIVNNANYLHYMEHTRHQFLLSRGVSFAKLHDDDIDCVVARVSAQFKVPLHSGDEFLSFLNVKKDGVKYIFLQEIYRASDQRLCNRATVETVCLVKGRLSTCPELDAAFSDALLKD